VIFSAAEDEAGEYMTDKRVATVTVAAARIVVADTNLSIVFCQVALAPI